MATYDDQLLKWVCARKNLNPSEIARIWFETYDSGSGCPTCDYGRETGFELTISFVDHRNSTSEIIHLGLDEILKEIIEA